MQQPLSQTLVELLNENSAQVPLTLNMLLERTQGRGLYILMVVLCLPFVVPLSVPGLSTVMGITIFVLAVRQAVGKPPRLPRALGERPLPDQLKQRVVVSGAKVLCKLEKLVRPRRTHWLSWPAARLANGLLIAVMAFLLALPLPSPPFFFTNSFPSYTIILLALSMMERDGLTIWLGYAAAAGTLAYFGFWADLILNHLVNWVGTLIELLRSMQ
jgi:hypothetical protein